MAISVKHAKVASKPESPRITNTDYNDDHVVEGVAEESHNHDGVYAPVLGSDDNYVTDTEKSNLHAPGSDDQDLSGLVPNTRTINGFPLTDDITIDTVQDGFLAAYFFCDDVIHSTTPPWHELEKQSDGGTVGSHTATTSNYTEMDRYVINPVPGTTLVPEGNWIFTLYAKVTAVTAMAGQLKAEVYRVDSDGAIVGAVLGTAESAAFTNTVVAPITLSVFIAEQTIDLTDTIGVIIYGKKTTAPAATITWYHDRASGYLSQMQSPITLLHNQLEGLNRSDFQGDYMHLSLEEWVTLVDGENADLYHNHGLLVRNIVWIEETPYTVQTSEYRNTTYIINVANCEITLPALSTYIEAECKFIDWIGSEHTFYKGVNSSLYFGSTSDDSYTTSGTELERYSWMPFLEGSAYLHDCTDKSKCYNLVTGKIPAPTAGDDGKYLQYDDATGLFVYDAPLTPPHNQLDGLNQDDYQHLTQVAWDSVIDGGNADDYHTHSRLMKATVAINETPYSFPRGDWYKLFIIAVDDCVINLDISEGGLGTVIEFIDVQGTPHTFNAFEDGLLYFRGTSDTSYTSRGILNERFVWKLVDSGYALIEANDASECYNLVAGKIPAPTAGDDGKYLQYDNASGEFVYDAPAGTGDVVGPGSSEDGNIAVFDGTGGLTIKDGGSTIAEVISSAKLAAWPVGAVYISVDSTSPATLFGGTWSAFGAGKVLVGIDSGDADFDTVEETGGSKTVAAAGTNAAEASHTHSVTSNVTSAANTGSESSHTHTYTQVPNHVHDLYELRSATTGSASTNLALSNDASSTRGSGSGYQTANPTGGVSSGTTSAGSSHNHSSPALTNNAVTSGAGSSHNHDFTGSATSVVQPYIVVYMWKRTA